MLDAQGFHNVAHPGRGAWTIPEGLRAIGACVVQESNLIGEPSAVLFRKEAAWPGFNPQLRQLVDLEMWFRLLERGKLVYTREPLCAFRRHELQQTAANNACGLAEEEHQRFFGHYLQKSWMPRGDLFSILFALRRIARREPERFTSRMRGLEEAAARNMGEGWYWFYWLGHRIARPYHNLKRSCQNRLFPTATQAQGV